MITFTSFSQKNTIKYSKARINYNTPENYNLLVQNGIPFENGKHKKGAFIESDFSSDEINVIKNLGIDVEILIDDVKKFYQERNTSNQKSSIDKNNSCSGASNSTYAMPNNYNHGSMGGFLTYNQVMQEIDSMTLLYPNLITARAPISTFTTFEGRNLYWVRMSDNPNVDETEPEVLYDAVHHAREPISIQQQIFFMWYLLENYATNTEVQAILNNTELYFVPFVNPDGYLYNESTDPNGGGMWRKNRRNHFNGDFGVDNNRNYNYTDVVNGPIWGTTGISFSTNSEVYCGTAAFSEPENQAMKWFVEQHDFKLALNNHSYSDLLLYPFGFDVNRPTPDDATYVAISDFMVSQNTMVNQLAADLYPASGDSDDWMYGETANHNKIFAFTPEIGTGSQGFWPSVGDIDPLCQSMMFLNITTAHLAGNYAKATDLQSFTLQNTSGYLKYKLQRIGMDNAGNFTVSILPISANLISVGSPKSHTAMSLLQIDTDSISYSLNPSIINGDIVTYVISVDNGIYTINDTITKTYGTQQDIFVDNGNNTSGWLVSQSWGITTSTYYSASSSITDSPTGNYTNNINKTITLMSQVSLLNTVAATLSFWAKWNIEDNWDFVQVEVSTDNGVSWTPQCGLYTHPGTTDQDFNKPLYDGVQSSWVKEQIDLSDYLNQNILVRFQIVSDGGVTADGFYFDDFTISVLYGTTSINEFTNNGAFLGQNIPNPTNDITTINYILPNDITNADLNITNELGQVLLKKNILGTQQSVKIPTNNLASGIYYYYITIGKLQSETKKMIIIK